MTTATTLSLFTTNLLVCHHVVQNTVASACILQSLSTHTENQLQPLLLQLELLLLLLIDVQSGHRTSVSHNLRLQCLVTDTAYRGVDHIRRRVVMVEHADGSVQYVLDRLVVVRRRVELGAIVSAGESESTYDVWISGHVDLDEPRWSWDSVFVGDGEGDEILSDVVDEPLGWFDRPDSPSCCCTCISRGGRWPYQFGSRNSSCLPASSSSTYAHPLGRPFICWDERGCRYFDGIFVVFVDEPGNLSCQHGDVRMCETNSGHFSMWHVGRSDKYGGDRCWYRDRIGGVVSMAVLHGAIASIAVSSIWLVVWVTGIIPVAHLVRLHSSILNRAASSCSCLHAMVVLIPSEGSEGSRMSKDARGFGKFN